MKTPNVSPWGRATELVRVLDNSAFESLFAMLAVLVGALQVFGDVSPNSVGSFLGHEQVRLLWGLYLIVGGVCVLSGILMRSPTQMDRGISVERLGLELLRLGFAVYAVAILVSLGSQSYAVVAFVGFLALGCSRRSKYLTRHRADLRALRDEIGAENA